ncbi:MAG TPA: hypothetical protein VM782_02550 [Stellaceae bacterium]|nr:hypothetical protein [Stellaceae bacterium]
MSTVVTIGYADGSPLETLVAVDLVVDGKIVAIARPDSSGKVEFPTDIAGKANVAVRMHPPSRSTDTPA